MYRKYYTQQFNRSFKKVIRSGRVSRELVEAAIDDLASGTTLDRRYSDHALTGDMFGLRECHIKPDLLLIYRIEKSVLVLHLVDIGSHSQVFG